MIPKGTQYVAVDMPGPVYVHYGHSTRTFREQEEMWSFCYKTGANKHDYRFREADWTPKLFKEFP